MIDMPVSSSCFNFYQSFYQFFQKFVICVKLQLSTYLVCHLIWILASLKWIVAQFAIFVTIAVVKMPLFVISLQIFVKPSITSCQIRHLRKIFHGPKNRQLSTLPFLSSHLNIWPNPWWMFGTLAIFLEICLCQYSPPHHLIWGFARPLMDSCPIPRFLKFAIFTKIANCQHACFVVSLSQSLPNSPVSQNVIFVKPTIIDYQLPLLSSYFNFCQTLNKFLPNLSFS